MSTRLHIVVPDELVARIDAARGEGQPRADWIRRVIEQALNRADGRRAARAVEQALGEFGEAGVASGGIPASSALPEPVTSAPAEQPLSRAEAFRRAEAARKEAQKR